MSAPPREPLIVPIQPLYQRMVPPRPWKGDNHLVLHIGWTAPQRPRDATMASARYSLTDVARQLQHAPRITVVNSDAHRGFLPYLRKQIPIPPHAVRQRYCPKLELGARVIILAIVLDAVEQFETRGYTEGEQRRAQYQPYIIRVSPRFW